MRLVSECDGVRLGEAGECDGVRLWEVGECVVEPLCIQLCLFTNMNKD